MGKINNTLLKLENIEGINLLRECNLKKIVDDISKKISCDVKKTCNN